MQNLKISIGIAIISLLATITLSAQNSGNFGGQAIQPDGKILIWGSNMVISGVPSGMIARLNPDGSRDASFSFCGCGFTAVHRVIPMPDGKIALSGYRTVSPFNLVAVSRINADGSADNTFTTFGDFSSNSGSLTILDVLPDGKIMALSIFNYGYPFGTSTDVRVINANGVGTAFSVGIGFGHNFQDALGGYKVLPDGRFYISKHASTYSGPVEMKRYSLNGGTDPTWRPPVFPSGIGAGVYALDTQPNGDVIIGGGFSSVNGTATNRVVRLTETGSLDSTFTAPANLTAERIKIQPSGKILVFDYNDILWRLNTDGSRDTTFAAAAPVERGFSVDTQGRIVSNNSFGYFRLNPDGDMDTTFVFGQNPPRADFDFDGDGRSDVGVFRPSNGNWYLSQSQAGYTEQNFGLNGDVITPGDFDGDGKTDLAIFRPSTGTWWYKSSISGAFHATSWGQTGDIPLASDFTGDGKADFVIYRPLGAIWFRLGSNGEYSPIQFGTSGDIPLVGDFNGDGKDDPAVYRPSTGTWWYANSADGQFYAIQWGGNFYDIPAPGDYDGDGKTDPAYFRSLSGTWYALNSSTNYSTYNSMNWGAIGDRPVPGDYDGDGKTDFAIFRPSNSMWFAMRSTSGFFSQQFGLNGDEAISNAFIP